MANVPLVSVIIPTYNRAFLIANAINSIKAQTHPNIQLIVVDDGSVDNTKEIVETFPGIEYYKKVNGGQGSARNHGLQYVKGKYI
jgi:glycosyltransferase involved in cell wall biosynthesis